MKKPSDFSPQQSPAKRFIKAFFVGLLCLGSVVSLNAQTQTIAGTVLSDDGPVAGATVTVQGTGTVTLTGADGTFSLAVPADATIEIGSFGYKTEVLTVGSRTRFDVRLTADVNVMETVVAIGYGTQKKALNTGATLNVTGDAITEKNTLSPLQALQGQTPGMLIMSTSGQPGEGMKVVIRGVGTIGNDVGPLYVIDGMPGGDINMLNPADIESVDVLKDAASAAIYGAQASGGVVLITTRKGTKGRANVKFDMYYGLQNASHIAEVLNAEEYKMIMDESAVNSGARPYDWDAMAAAGYGADTDWMKEMFVKNAVTQNYNLTISGGNDASTYLISLNNASQEGVLGGKDVSFHERYGFRVNSEHKLFGDLLTVGENINLNFTNRSTTGGGLGGAFTVAPINPLYGPNKYGSVYNSTEGSPWRDQDGNPVGSQRDAGRNQYRDQRLLGNIYAALAPLKGLTIRTQLGLNQRSDDSRTYDPLYSFARGAGNTVRTRVQQGSGNSWNLTWTNTANYDFTVADDHAIGVMLGMEASRNNGVDVTAANIILKDQFNSWEYAYVNNTTGQDYSQMTASGSPDGMNRTLSYFGRLNYNYKEKYLFNATLRRDGSSNFAKGHRWGTFPSFSFGWVVTNEPWMESLVTGSRLVDYLKVRASWGQVGNQRVSAFQYAAPINTNANYVFGDAKTSNVIGAYPNRLANPALGWETSQQIDLGLDARFFGGRLDMVFDWYQKTTIDWMVEAPILATAGATAPYVNGGNVRNSGVELGFTWNDRIGEFSYRVGINGSYNKNHVVDIPNSNGIMEGQWGALYANAPEAWRVQEGEPFWYFLGWETEGVFQNQQQIDDRRAQNLGIFQPEVAPGDVIFTDQDRDGDIDDDDKVNIGDGIPDYNLGLSISLGWKGIDLSISGYGMLGHQVVQQYRDPGTKQHNYPRSILNRWTSEGSSNKIPRVLDTSNGNWLPSELLLHNANFFKINNITLGYDLARVINVNWMSKFRVYAQLQNYFVFTKYDGNDPEVGAGWGDNAVWGVDKAIYPRPKTILFGASLTF